MKKKWAATAAKSPAKTITSPSTRRSDPTWADVAHVVGGRPQDSRDHDAGSGVAEELPRERHEDQPVQHLLA